MKAIVPPLFILALSMLWLYASTVGDPADRTIEVGVSTILFALFFLSIPTDESR